MRKFFNFAHTDYEKLAKIENDALEEIIFNYIIHLKRKTEKTGIPNPNTYRSILAPIQTFLEQNDILLNWKKLRRYCPAKIELSNQLPYKTEHIQKMLQLVNCPRDVAFVHLLASTGIRVGAVFHITCGDVHYIEDGAVIDIRKSKTTPYRTCITPEATTALKDYLATRGNTDDDDPLFTVRNNSRALTDGSIKDVMKRIRNKIGLNEGKGQKSKNAYSANHAFRKRVEIVFSKAGVESSFKKYLTNHDMTVSVNNYFRGVENEDLWDEFKKAIPELTISETKRLTAKHEAEKEKLTQDIPEQYKEKLESIESQLVEMKEREAIRVVDFYQEYAESRGAKDISEIKTKLTDGQLEEIEEADAVLDSDGIVDMSRTPSQEMLRKRNMISMQETIISNLKSEIDELPKSNNDYERNYELIRKSELKTAQKFLKELKIRD